MKIVLEVSRCRHCNFLQFYDITDEPYCMLTREDVTDYDKCDEFELSDDVAKELKETLGFKESEIRFYEEDKSEYNYNVRL